MFWGARAGLLLASMLALPGCSDRGSQSAPPPATMDEQRAVADAAEMLGERAATPEIEPPVASEQDSIE